MTGEELKKIALKHSTIVGGYEFAQRFDFDAIAAELAAQPSEAATGSEPLSKLIEAVAKDAVKLAIVRSDLKPDEGADLTDEGVIADAVAALMGYDICEEGPMQSVKDLVRAAQPLTPNAGEVTEEQVMAFLSKRNLAVVSMNSLKSLAASTPAGKEGPARSHFVLGQEPTGNNTLWPSGGIESFSGGDEPPCPCDKGKPEECLEHSQGADEIEPAPSAAKEAPAGLPQDVADFIVNAANFLRSRDNMNATLHLSDVQLSPLTQTAAGLIDRFKIGPQPAIVEAAAQPPAPSGALPHHDWPRVHNKAEAAAPAGRETQLRDWSKRLWEVSQRGNMVIENAGIIQQVAREMDTVLAADKPQPPAAPSRETELREALEYYATHCDGGTGVAERALALLAEVKPRCSFKTTGALSNEADWQCALEEGHSGACTPYAALAPNKPQPPSETK